MAPSSSPRSMTLQWFDNEVRWIIDGEVWATPLSQRCMDEKKKVGDLTKPNKSQARKVHDVWEAANLTHGGAGYSEEKFHEICYRLL